MHHVVTLHEYSPQQNLIWVRHWHCHTFLNFQANPMSISPMNVNCLHSVVILQGGFPHQNLRWVWYWPLCDLLDLSNWLKVLCLMNTIILLELNALCCKRYREGVQIKISVGLRGSDITHLFYFFFIFNFSILQNTCISCIFNDVNYLCTYTHCGLQYVTQCPPPLINTCAIDIILITFSYYKVCYMYIMYVQWPPLFMHLY